MKKKEGFIDQITNVSGKEKFYGQTIMLSSCLSGGRILDSRYKIKKKKNCIAGENDCCKTCVLTSLITVM